MKSLISCSHQHSAHVGAAAYQTLPARPCGARLGALLKQHVSMLERGETALADIWAQAEEDMPPDVPRGNINWQYQHQQSVC